MTEVAILARPGAKAVRISWDGWRQGWAVACRARAVRGQASEELLQVLAEALAVPRSAVRWARGARSRVKVLQVDGLSAEEVHRRLERCERSGADLGARPVDAGPIRQS